MDTLITVAVSLAASVTPFYLYAVIRWHRILQLERPSLVDKSGSLSFFYRGLPRVGDPNVGVAVIRAAFSGVAKELEHPGAELYARGVRWGLSIALPLYLFAMVAEFAGAP